MDRCAGAWWAVPVPDATDVCHACLLKVHELKRDSEAEKVIRAASDAAAQAPDKAFHVLIACGSDSTVNAGAALEVAA